MRPLEVYAENVDAASTRSVPVHPKRVKHPAKEIDSVGLVSRNRKPSCTLRRLFDWLILAYDRLIFPIK